jgi:hypothetical protein
MGQMAEITDRMQRRMSMGWKSPEERNQILNMMKQMSRMMRKMSVRYGDKV